MPEITEERLAELEDAERIAWAFSHLNLARLCSAYMDGKNWRYIDPSVGYRRVNIIDIDDEFRAVIDTARNAEKGQPNAQNRS